MRGVAVALTLALAACGRIGFDSFGAGTGDDVANPDASGDGALVDGMLEASGWTTMMPPPPTTADLYTVVAFSDTNVWVGGADGDAYQWDGTQWNARAGLVQDAYMMWGLTSTDLWSVGRLCEVRRWTGSAWTPVTVPGCQNTSYFAVAGISTQDLWIAGVGGDIRHVVNSTFTLLAQANNIDLWFVWPVSATEAYFTGTKGTILRWTGGTTFVDESLALQNAIVTSMWGAPGGDLWVVGSGGVIFRKAVNTTTWQQVASPTTTFLYWIYGTSANDVWAVGEFGVALHYDGTEWKQVSVPATTALRAITKAPGGGLRMVGHGGTVLRLP